MGNTPTEGGPILQSIIRPRQLACVESYALGEPLQCWPASLQASDDNRSPHPRIAKSGPARSLPLACHPIKEIYPRSELQLGLVSGESQVL